MGRKNAIKEFRILVAQIVTCCRRDYFDYFKVYTIKAENERKAKSEARRKWVGKEDPFDMAEFKVFDVTK